VDLRSIEPVRVLQVLPIPVDDIGMHGHCKFRYTIVRPHALASECLFQQTALSQNITTDQAFCMISSCLTQIQQSPVTLGRKKREVIDNATDDGNTQDTTESAEESVSDRAREMPVAETVELVINGTLHKLLVVSEVMVNVGDEVEEPPDPDTII
jgi:hypothetical protein